MSNLTYEQSTQLVAFLWGKRVTNDATVMIKTLEPAIVEMLAEVWDESHEHCCGTGCPNPYRSE